MWKFLNKNNQKCDRLRQKGEKFQENFQQKHKHVCLKFKAKFKFKLRKRYRVKFLDL